MTVWSLPEWSPGPPLPPRRHEDLDVGACVQPQLGDGEKVKIRLQALELLVPSGDHRAVAEVPQPHQPGGGWDGRSWQESCRRGSPLSQVRRRVGNVEVFFNFSNFFRIISSDWGLADWVQRLIGANKVSIEYVTIPNLTAIPKGLLCQRVLNRWP